MWNVEERDGRILVKDRRRNPVPSRKPAAAPASIVVVGAGAAGHAAVEQLRREGYPGPVTLIDSDPDEPFDKPNLSKDYLAGNAPEEWIPLRPDGYYAEHGVEHLPGRRVVALDTTARTVRLDNGHEVRWERLLLAPGARPIRLPDAVDPGARVLYLRSLADSRGIIRSVQGARTAVVIGASFIGLEVAASLRQRGLEVHVVAPEPVPLARVLGDALGAFVRRLHEAHGVRFHLGRTVKRVDASEVQLDAGDPLPADIVVAGIGVRPETSLASEAGLAVENGILVNDRLETSARSVFAAGDAARFPDARSAAPVRIEHWVVAQRMGQHVARNMLGADAPFVDPPFFWSQHYDVTIAYVGHAAEWDRAETDGDPDARDCTVRYLREGEVQAVATIFRDRESLEVEAGMQQAAGA